MNMDFPAGPEGHSLSSSDESLSLRCNVLAESLFDEDSLLSFFNDREQKEFKARAIENVCKDHDWKTLSTLGMSKYGFVTTLLRRECWYALLSEQLKTSGSDVTVTEDNSKKHKDEGQVLLDVNRSFTNVSDACRKNKLRKLLEHIIVKILRKYPKLNYYQGYHDVVSVFIIVYIEGHDYHDENEFLSLSGMTTNSGDDVHGSSAPEDRSNGNSSTSTELYESEANMKINVEEDRLFKCVEAFTLLYLRDFMMDSLDFPIDQLRIIPQLIKKDDKQFYKKLHFDKIEPFFAISSILTIFSHELKPSENKPDSLIFQIFDFVISSQSMMVPLTMYALLIMRSKAHIIEEYNANIQNFENTVDLVHGVIQQVVIASSYDEKVWKMILEEARSQPSKESVRKYRSILNKYSTLLTTASGLATAPYELDYVLKLLDREIDLNTRRKDTKGRHRLRNMNGVRTLANLFASNSFPLILKVSLLVGVLSIFVKFYRDGSLKAMLPTIKLYIKRHQHSSFSGIYRGIKGVWLDPLHELLKRPSLPVWASKVAQTMSPSNNSDF